MPADSKITPFTNVGKTWKGNDGHTYKLAKVREPKIVIRLSTYIGGSAIGAMHWYCRVRADTPSIRDTTEGRTLCMGGYGPDKPNVSYDFNAERVVTKVEKDMSGDVVAPVGDTTSRFNDPETALRAGIETALANFKDTPRHKWIVRFDGPLGEEFDLAEFNLDELDADEILAKVDWEI